MFYEIIIANKSIELLAYPRIIRADLSFLCLIALKSPQTIHNSSLSLLELSNSVQNEF